MEAKKAKTVDLVASCVGLLLVILVVEIQPPFDARLLLLDMALAAAALTLTVLVYRRVG